MSAKGHAKDFLFGILKYASLCLGAFATLFPLVSVLITAFKTNDEYASTNVMELPANWLNFENFSQVWTRGGMLLAFRNSAVILVAVLAGSIMLSSMTAYVLNRFRFMGNGLIKSLFLFATLIPGVAMQVTVYQIMYSFGLVNTIVGYIVLLLGTDVISIYIFIQFFETLPDSLDESAVLDGCTYFGVFFKILFPLLRPAIITCMILKGVATYNEYYMANLYLQDKSRLQVVATSLYTFTGPMGNQYNYICAGVIITIIPALLIFIFCQRQIYAGLAAGAVKG
jgi:multiple sugar transport system permease protein